MQVFAKAFWLQKAGNAREEYEDAYYPEKPFHEEGDLFRFTVADGASEAWLSGLWARLLVSAYVEGRLSKDEDFLPGLIETQSHWKREAGKIQLPPYAAWEAGIQRIESGAFSSLLGLELKGEGTAAGEWRSIAMGDSCLFHVRREELLRAFPIQRYADFNNRPILVSSNPNRNESILEKLLTTAGDWKRDDSFFLMTDALACWFLNEHENGRLPWAVLRDLDTYDEVKPFEEWVEEKRTDRSLRNDDVTLLRVDLA